MTARKRPDQIVNRKSELIEVIIGCIDEGVPLSVASALCGYHHKHLSMMATELGLSWRRQSQPSPALRVKMDKLRVKRIADKRYRVG